MVLDVELVKISVLRSKNPYELAGNFAAQDTNFSLYLELGGQSIIQNEEDKAW